MFVMTNYLTISAFALDLGGDEFLEDLAPLSNEQQESIDQGLSIASVDIDEAEVSLSLSGIRAKASGNKPRLDGNMELSADLGLGQDYNRLGIQAKETGTFEYLNDSDVKVYLNRVQFPSKVSKLKIMKVSLDEDSKGKNHISGLYLPFGARLQVDGKDNENCAVCFQQAKLEVALGGGASIGNLDDLDTTLSGVFGLIFGVKARINTSKFRSDSEYVQNAIDFTNQAVDHVDISYETENYVDLGIFGNNNIKGIDTLNIKTVKQSGVNKFGYEFINTALPNEADQHIDSRTHGIFWSSDKKQYKVALTHDVKREETHLQYGIQF